MEALVANIQQFGFPIVAMVGLGYFVYFVWTTITKTISLAIKEMQFAIIKLIDQIRMLDNDMIRLQQKVNTVLQMKENDKKRHNRR
jgi:F0F1-type ATP synthase membrane subunit b/b'